MVALQISHTLGVIDKVLRKQLPASILPLTRELLINGPLINMKQFVMWCLQFINVACSYQYMYDVETVLKPKQNTALCSEKLFYNS